MKFRESVLSHLRASGYRPVNVNALGRELKLDKRNQRQLAHEVRLMLSKGDLIVVKGDRLAVPGDEELVTGKLQFRAGGSAFVIPQVKSGQPSPDAIQIASEDTGVGLHGDIVQIRVNPGHQAKRRGTGNEQTGRVMTIVQRGRTEVVGTL